VGVSQTPAAFRDVLIVLTKSWRVLNTDYEYISKKYILLLKGLHLHKAENGAAVTLAHRLKNQKRTLFCT
jgi:hypothetical protein